MLRLAAILFSLIGLAFAGPAAAQSLNLVAMPIVYVSKPVVQQVHAGRPIAPAAQAIVRPQQQKIAGLAAARPQYQMSATPLPLWKAPPAIDRQYRNYNRGIAQYGPFLVLDSRRVALVGETDRRSPGAFRAMLRDFPGLEQLDMVECPGTRDDIANMKLGRLIRAAGMVTHVPSIGSVRSGAVELFLAGVERDIADGAEFAVHSWIDDYGREAADYAVDAPENRKYIDYYREMGMGAEQARAFYDFTNSVPHRSALWLGARDMRRWSRPGLQMVGERRPTARAIAPQRALREEPHQAPQLVYADMTFS